MGGRHKLRLPLGDGRSVFEHALEQANSWAPAQMVVVLQPASDDLLAAVTSLGANPVVNKDYASGMSTSLRAGISALRPDIDAALILLGDEPFVERSIIEALVEAYEREDKPVTIPVYGDVPGPPTLFRRSVFPELLALTGDEGGRQVVRKDPSRVARVLLSTGTAPPDLDTREDYERYLRHSDI
jgi:molybdenum cofactor cytidylyltransferase